MQFPKNVLLSRKKLFCFQIKKKESFCLKNEEMIGGGIVARAPTSALSSIPARHFKSSRMSWLKMLFESAHIT